METPTGMTRFRIDNVKDSFGSSVAMTRKKFALLVFIVFDLMAIEGIYAGYQWLSEIFVQVNGEAEIIEYSKYSGFMFAGIMIPILHIYIIIICLLPSLSCKSRIIAEKGLSVFIILLLVSCILLINWVPYKLGKEGYVYCQTSRMGVASRVMIYTIDDEVCQELGPGKYQQLWDNALGKQ